MRTIEQDGIPSGAKRGLDFFGEPDFFDQGAFLIAFTNGDLKKIIGP